MRAMKQRLDCIGPEERQPTVAGAPRGLRISLVIALNYIALVFAADFIEGPLKRGGNYPLSYS
jgi:hypothetical protein